jgi:hypothetical protein
MIPVARLHTVLASYTGDVDLGLADADLTSHDRRFCVDGLRLVLRDLNAWGPGAVTLDEALSLLPPEWTEPGTERARTIVRNIVDWR